MHKDMKFISPLCRGIRTGYIVTISPVFSAGRMRITTPFIRLEPGHAFRNRDLRDMNPANNSVPLLIPQILPGNADEFRELTRLVASNGYQRIDINLGCPFPLIAGKKKGAGMLPYPELVKETLSPIE